MPRTVSRGQTVHRPGSQVWSNKILSLFFKKYVCIDVLPAHVSVYRVCLVPVEVGRESQLPWKWSYRWS